MAIASPTSPDMPVRINASSSHSTLESLPLTLESLPLTDLPHQPGKHILHQLNQGPNPLKDRNRFMEQDGVVQYVNTMLAVENYWSCVSRQKVAILGRLIYYMQVGSAGARAVSAQMGPRMEAAVEHELWSWIYFHERIIEVLDGKLPQPHSHPCLAR